MAAAADSKSQATVFYSWQSDLPNSTNRGLILEALERAAKKIRTDNSVAVEPVVDRDTLNVPGAPDIAHTIFAKIEKADAFVADVTVINPGFGRPTPNPNVLIELGYALKTLGSSRTILVANTVNGPIEALPFDLRTKRVLTYHLPDEADDKPEQRKKLQEGLETALRTILAGLPTSPALAVPSLADKAVESIEAKDTSQSVLCYRFMLQIANRIKELTPNLEGVKIDNWDDDLVEAIGQSLPLATDFARVADIAALYDSCEAALGLFRGFAPLFTQYNLPPRTGGSFYHVQFDLPKFLGHELMVTLIAAFIAARRWKTVAAICRETVLVSNVNTSDGQAVPVNFFYASAPVQLLEHRSRRLQLNRVSLHADILKERHGSRQLGKLSPWRQFQDADAFLYLRSILEQDEVNRYHVWMPWSALLIREGCPDYLFEAMQRDKAEQLVEPLGVKNLAELRNRLKQRTGLLTKVVGQWNPFFDPIAGLKPDLIGTK
jgi:hypothetical protein